MYLDIFFTVYERNSKKKKIEGSLNVNDMILSGRERALYPKLVYHKLGEKSSIIKNKKTA